MTLSLENIGYERKQKMLFHTLNCTVSAGECLQVRGANGAGKSTLLRIMAGLLEPQQGNVLWQGISILRQREEFQQQLHYIGHHSGMKSRLTVFENMVLSTALKITTKPFSIDDVIKKMGLNTLRNTLISELSAGQLRRLSLARLFLHSAPIWLLDEPTTALDQTGQELLLQQLEEHLTNGGMAIIATHHELTLKKPVKTLHVGEKSYV